MHEEKWEDQEIGKTVTDIEDADGGLGCKPGYDQHGYFGTQEVQQADEKKPAGFTG
jgi:hypothetical protein